MLPYSLQRVSFVKTLDSVWHYLYFFLASIYVKILGFLKEVFFKISVSLVYYLLFYWLNYHKNLYVCHDITCYDHHFQLLNPYNYWKNRVRHLQLNIHVLEMFLRHYRFHHQNSEVTSLCHAGKFNFFFFWLAIINLRAKNQKKKIIIKTQCERNSLVSFQKNVYKIN